MQQDQSRLVDSPNMNTGKLAVELRDVSVHFAGKRGETSMHVLDRINLTVLDGEFICLVGPSGCGKSTILNILGGFQRATSGLVQVGGEPVQDPDPRRIFVFQESSVFPWLTVEENVGFGQLRRNADERKKIVAHYVAMVGLAGFERAYPRELSGGMRQRVELARALAANPEVIYLDEPFGALDYLTRLKMRADLTRIWQSERKTIILVTHDIDEAVQLADRIIVLSPRPARIREVVTINLPRIRDQNSEAYLEARSRIFAAMEQPDFLQSSTK